MVFRLALGALALALLLPFLHERGRVLTALFWRNAPHRLVRINRFASHEVRFADRIRSCEDAVLVESEGVAILGCDPGRERWNTVMGIFLPEPVESGALYVFDYKDAGAPDDEALKQLRFVDFAAHGEADDIDLDFHPLGMAYDEATATLLVASHRRHGGGGSPAVEMFRLDLRALTATHLRSVRHPLLHGPNAIALVPGRGGCEFYVTNNNHFLVRDHPLLNRVETNLGLPGGTIVHVDVGGPGEGEGEDRDAPPRAAVVGRVGFANGIELLNATTAAVASSARAKIYFFSIAAAAAAASSGDDGTTTNATSRRGAPRFARTSELALPFSPDNLSVSRDGALLIAGHPHIPSLGRFARTRHLCNSNSNHNHNHNSPAVTTMREEEEEEEETCASLTAPSWAARWTEAGGLEHLYADVEYPSSATAARDSDRGVGIIAGLYAKGILVWRE